MFLLVAVPESLSVVFRAILIQFARNIVYNSSEAGSSFLGQLSKAPAALTCRSAAFH